MLFPEKFINELVQRSDIVDVVSGYVRLGKRSGSNMFGLCPFHSEKTPSFSVSPDKQIFHCFGCGKGGGVINFIMEIENLAFPDAVEFLARRAGMPIPAASDDPNGKKRARMLSLNKDAARFFYEQLSSPDAAAAREYMSKRRIGSSVAVSFGIGYAPNDWSRLLDAMLKRSYSEQELFEAGLARKGKNGGFYDTFRNRLMFPVIDVRGNVIGFSGRILDDGEPKYMNSPETLVFNKSQNLFALNLAKKSKSGYIILSEGNIDVVSLHQAGFDSAVASLGTSLTDEQARLLARYTGEVVIAYDSDGAGLKASQRAIGILEKLDIKVKVLHMSGAKDPDEYIKLNGADAFRNLLEASENQIDYRLRLIKERYDLSVDEQKIAFLKDSLELISQLYTPVERQVYSMRVAQMTGISSEVVEKEAERLRKKKLSSYLHNSERQLSRPEKQAQPSKKELRYTDPASAAAEEGIVRLLYLEPELAKKQPLPQSSEFSSPALAHIFEAILQNVNTGSAVSTATVSVLLSSDEMSLLAGILQKPEQLSRCEATLRAYINRMRECKELSDGSVDLRALAEKLRKNKGYKE